MAATASVEKGCLRAPYLEGFVHSLAIGYRQERLLEHP